MPIAWFIFFVVIIAGLAISAGVLRNRHFQYLQQLHQDLADGFGLSLAYRDRWNFKIFGKIDGYMVSVEAYKHSHSKGESSWFTRLAMPMKNPNRRSFKILRAAKEEDVLKNLVQIDRGQAFGQEIGDWLEMSTNDIVFASFILTPDIKIRIHELFHPLDRGLMYLQDDEMVILLPFLLTSRDKVNTAKIALSLLEEVKAELN